MRPQVQPTPPPNLVLPPIPKKCAHIPHRKPTNQREAKARLTLRGLLRRHDGPSGPPLRDRRRGEPARLGAERPRRRRRRQPAKREAASLRGEDLRWRTGSSRSPSAEALERVRVSRNEDEGRSRCGGRLRGSMRRLPFCALPLAASASSRWRRGGGSRPVSGEGVYMVRRVVVQNRPMADKEIAEGEAKVEGREEAAGPSPVVVAPVVQ
jgi:hypothetical protein